MCSSCQSQVEWVSSNDVGMLGEFITSLRSTEENMNERDSESYYGELISCNQDWFNALTT